MNYSKMVGFPKPVPVELKGIGDEPMRSATDGMKTVTRKPSNVSMHGVKVDQHSSFPKGLPITFCVHDERAR